jgi:hypothetical protein
MAAAPDSFVSTVDVDFTVRVVRISFSDTERSPLSLTLVPSAAPVSTMDQATV